MIGPIREGMIDAFRCAGEALAILAMAVVVALGGGAVVGGLYALSLLAERLR